MKIKHGYIQNPGSIPADCQGAGWIYFSEDDKSIYLDSGNGPVKYSGSGEGSDVDLSNYYTKTEVDNKIPSLDDLGDLVTTRDVTVSGMNIGNLQEGQVIEKGTTFTQFLERFLNKIIGVKGQNPTAQIALTPYGKYEVGTTVQITIGYNFVDGKWIGEEGYDYSENMGCEVISVRYFKNNEEINTNIDNLVVIDGITTYEISVRISNPKTIPVNNVGEPIDIQIRDITTSSSAIIKGYYKYFMGYSDKTNASQFTSDDVRALTVKSGLIEGKTTIVGDSSITSNGKSIVIACPKTRSLTSVKNGVGANILGNFKSGEVTVTNGNASTVYIVYVYPITNGAKVEFKNVVIE